MSFGASLLPLAVRAYTLPDDDEDAEPDSPRRRQGARLPEALLVFDTETSVDYSQRLNFGCWRYYRLSWDELEPRATCVEEGLFYADDLPARDARGFARLRRYADERAPEVDRQVPDAAWRLRLVPAREFAREVLVAVGFRARAWIVGFNLPFDLSRVAQHASTSRDYLAGGFSLTLAQYLTRAGEWREDRYRNRVAIKALDSKRQLIGFKRRAELDAVDAIPEGETTPQRGYVPRGYFLDLRTLAFALTNESYSLKQACKDFGVEHGKQKVKQHGVITPRYISYNRADVRASGELFAKLMAAYRRHPIKLAAPKALSPASIGKAYLRAMGVRPPRQRQPDFPKSMLGRGMVAYYGGRAECRIRRTVVPVVYCDFLSMYPTANALMGLWQLVTAAEVEVVEGDEVTAEVRALLERTTLDDCFRPTTWSGFVGLVELEPDGDVLPTRSRYGYNESWGIGVNPLTSRWPLWYTIPDAIAAKLLTPDRSPRVRRALRLRVKDGRHAVGLRAVELPGGVAVDPRERDLFRAVIEERHRLRGRPELDEAERKQADQFLKVLANSSSYGIYAETWRRDAEPGSVSVYGLEHFVDPDVRAPESPGEFAFAPMAACITGAARLMLALAERLVTDRGGSYAFCDTDSLAIVASKEGGLVRCPGGTERLGGGEAIQALSWSEVEEVRERFTALNPHDSEVVPGSVLELEDQNFKTRRRVQRRQLYCYAISAKRYALFGLGPDGELQLRHPTKRKPGEKWSEHGLGHVLNPLDPDDPDRDWIRALWQLELERILGADPTAPDWLSRPAVGRLTVSKPTTREPFDHFNQRKPYAEQVKPYNFMLTAQLAINGRPARAETPRFHLLAPWEADPRRWLDLAWFDKYATDGGTYRITTDIKAERDERTAVVQTYAELLADYRVHPEPKSLGPSGHPAGWHDDGVLRRRPVQVTRIVHIGKEANELDETQAGVMHGMDEVLNQHLTSDEWNDFVLEVLANMTRAQRRALGLSGSNVSAVRARTYNPTRRTKDRLTTAAGEFARANLRAEGVLPPGDPVDCCAAYLNR